MNPIFNSSFVIDCPKQHHHLIKNGPLTCFGVLWTNINNLLVLKSKDIGWTWKKMAFKIHMWSSSCITLFYTKTSYGPFIVKGPNYITPSHTKHLVKLSFQKVWVVLPHPTPKHILEFSFQKRFVWLVHWKEGRGTL